MGLERQKIPCECLLPEPLQSPHNIQCFMTRASSALEKEEENFICCNFAVILFANCYFL